MTLIGKDSNGEEESVSFSNRLYFDLNSIYHLQKKAEKPHWITFYFITVLKLLTVIEDLRCPVLQKIITNPSELHE